MDWGSYLARGTTYAGGVFPASFVSQPSNAAAILQLLKSYHHFIVEVDHNDQKIMEEWENVVKQAFDLSEEEKMAGGAYRSERGLAVGYKRDHVRQFFETRLTSSGIPSPTYSIHAHKTPLTYTHIVQSLVCVLSRLAVHILHRLEEAMGLNRGVLVRLTDLQMHAQQAYHNQAEAHTVPTLSSSLLRICCYHNFRNTSNRSAMTDADADADADSSAVRGKRQSGGENFDWHGDDNEQATSNISDSHGNAAEVIHASEHYRQTNVGDGREMGGFGAHTDTSFITLCPHPSVPGLDIFHPVQRRWVSIEDHGSSSSTSYSPQHNWKYCVTVFTGEFLQILTKHKLQACIHRVRIPHLSSRDVRRISCPFIIRSHDAAQLDLDTADGEDEADGKVVDDAGSSGWISRGLHGVDMFTIHKLLDLKRQRCFKQHADDENKEWVLSAFGASTTD